MFHFDELKLGGLHDSQAVVTCNLERKFLLHGVHDGDITKTSQ